MERTDRLPGNIGAFKKNRERIMRTQTVCGICGKPVDFSLKYPHPMSATVDHIIPVSKGGHPTDIDNLQLAHRCCNRAKSDRLEPKNNINEQRVVSNRELPATFNWTQKPLKPMRQL